MMLPSQRLLNCNAACQCTDTRTKNWHCSSTPLSSRPAAARGWSFFNNKPDIFAVAPLSLSLSLAASKWSQQEDFYSSAAEAAAAAGNNREREKSRRSSAV